MPKDYTCAICPWVFKVIKENIMLVRYDHEFFHVCQKICSWVSKDTIENTYFACKIFS